MHVHNVSSYAPPGYQLAQTLYEGGATKHVFARVDSPSDTVTLECIPSSAAEEIGYLESFRDMHTPKAPAVVEAEPAVVAEAPVRAPRKRV